MHHVSPCCDEILFMIYTMSRGVDKVLFALQLHHEPVPSMLFVKRLLDYCVRGQPARTIDTV